MSATLLTNVMVLDSTGAEPFPGEVLVEGNRIKKVAKGRSQIARDSAADVIDGQGMTLMAGMTEGHCHPSFTGVAQTWELGMVPPEEHTLKTAANAKLLLDCGFTSIYCAASAKPRLDVVVQERGQRGRAAGPQDARGQPRDRRHRRARRRAHDAPAPRELLAHRRRARGGPQGGAHVHPRGCRQRQAQHLGRRLLPELAGRRHDLHGRRGQDGLRDRP